MCVNDRVRPFVPVQAALAGLVLSRLARGRERRAPLAPGAVPALRVSVVIPARDEQDRIGPVLRALAGDPDVHEMLVVDDHSTDATAALAAELGARVLTLPPLPPGWVGKPWALQHGLEQATGDLVVALDADVRPDPGLVRALAGALAERPERTLLTGTVRFACETPGSARCTPPSWRRSCTASAPVTSTASSRARVARWPTASVSRRAARRCWPRADSPSRRRT